MNRSCPGTSTNAISLARRQRHPREAEVDGHAPALLRLPAVRLHPGERAHQHRLPVIHMTRGRDDVHCYSRPGEEAGVGRRRVEGRRVGGRRAGSRRGEHRRGEPLVVGGRDGTQVEQQPAALDPADDRRHVAAAHRRARPQLRRPAARAGTARRSAASRRDRRRRRPRPRSPPPGSRRPRRPAARPAPRPAPVIDARVAVRAWVTGAAGPVERGLERGQGQLVHPQRPGQRMAREAGDRLRPGPAAGRPAARRAACRRWP